MRRALISISALLLATLVMYLSAGQQGILIPVRAGLEGFSTLTVGFFGTAYAAGFVGGCYLVPWLLRRVGHIRTFSVMAALAASSILLKGVWLDPLVWTGLRVVAGVAIAGAAIVIESWLNARATNANRGAIFSAYMAVYLVAVTAGQLSLMLFDPAAVTMFVSSGVLFALALIPTALTLMPAPEAPEQVELRVRALYALSPVGAVGAFVIGLANGAFGTLGAVYAQENGFDRTGIAIFISLALVAGAVAQWPLGRLSDLMDRRIVICAVAFWGMGAGLALALFGEPGPRAFALIAGFGVAAYSLYGLVVAHANDHADPAQFVAVSGGLLLLFGIGSAVGPAVAAMVAELAGNSSALFVFTAASHALLAGFSLYRIQARAPVAEAEKESFVGLARPTSPEAAVLDPRHDESLERPAPEAGAPVSYLPEGDEPAR